MHVCLCVCKCTRVMQYTKGTEESIRSPDMWVLEFKLKSSARIASAEPSLQLWNTNLLKMPVHVQFKNIFHPQLVKLACVEPINTEVQLYFCPTTWGNISKGFGWMTGCDWLLAETFWGYQATYLPPQGLSGGSTSNSITTGSDPSVFLSLWGPKSPNKFLDYREGIWHPPH